MNILRCIRRRRACAVALGCLLGLGSTQAARALVALTTESLPFSYTAPDGRIVGVSADVVTDMARRAALPLMLDNQRPWARAMWDAQHLPETCAFSVSREADREALFQWIGPIASNTWALFARKDFSATLASLDDARGYRIGGLRGDAKTEFLVARGLPVETIGNDRGNAAKLAAHRIDLWVTGLYTGERSAAAEGITDIKPVLVFHETPSYLACSHATSADTVRRLEEALQSLRKDGFIKKNQEQHRAYFGW
jgi:polar amino acid transport system substrate-binding protein